MENIKTYLVLATPKDGSKPYFIHNGTEFSLEYAEAECRDCNRCWGDRIEYRVIDATLRMSFIKNKFRNNK